MKVFLGGEGFWQWLERATYRGAIGLFYKDTLTGILAYAIVIIIAILAIIGLISVIGWIISHPKKKKSKMNSGEKWLKTGKW